MKNSKNKIYNIGFKNHLLINKTKILCCWLLFKVKLVQIMT